MKLSGAGGELNCSKSCTQGYCPPTESDEIFVNYILSMNCNLHLDLTVTVTFCRSRELPQQSWLQLQMAASGVGWQSSHASWAISLATESCTASECLSPSSKNISSVAAEKCQPFFPSKWVSLLDQVRGQEVSLSFIIFFIFRSSCQLYDQ